jgi:hypothetical protein
LHGVGDISVAKTIAESFKIAEHSREFYSLIHIEGRNFDRLLAQIALSDISPVAKQLYQNQTTKLATIVRFDVLHAKFLNFKTGTIDPNIGVLTYLDDALRLTGEIGEAELDELLKIKEALQEVLAEVLASSLPLHIRVQLREQLEALIFSITNFDCVGADIVWQQSAAMFVTAHRDAHAVETPEDKNMFGRLGAAVSRVIVVLTVFNYGTGQLDSGLQHTLSIGRQLKSGYEAMESWRSKPVPKIENKSDDSARPKPV